MARQLKHEDAVFALALGAAAVPASVAIALLWSGGFEAKTRWTLTLFIVGGAFGFAAAARARVLGPLQVIANLIAGLRERDYSVRGRRRRDDALGLALDELSQLAGELREERHRDEEAAAGLARVVEGLEVAVLAIDRGGAVRLANRAAERLLDGLDLPELLEGPHPRTVRLGATTFEVRRSEVRLSGVPHALLVLTDVQRALRAEEREAWQRLVRVLGHEINNSLGPIRSIAETLRTTLAKVPRPDDADEDLGRGLAVIERRADSLARFMASYARLARLPPPRPGRVEVAGWLRRTAALETRLAVEVEPGPPIEVPGDADQLDQLLINLVANAADAALETGGGVRLRWEAGAGDATILVEDDGPGIAETANLFVPFFTTKPAGSGIGLVLARQIAEAHGGSIALINREGARGCQARITLPRGSGTTARPAGDR